MKEEFHEGPSFKGELESILILMVEKWEVVLVDMSGTYSLVRAFMKSYGPLNSFLGNMANKRSTQMSSQRKVDAFSLYQKDWLSRSKVLEYRTNRRRRRSVVHFFIDHARRAARWSNHGRGCDARQYRHEGLLQ